MGVLYLVSTPIGNLDDITYRAVKTLSNVSFIAAEDTRVSGKLLSHYGIQKELISYHEHNKRHKGEYIIQRLNAGEDCALISDAGTPAISDPGYDLVCMCADSNIDIVPIPGICAAVAALTVSAINPGRFCFEGFLSVSNKKRSEHLNLIENEYRTIIFYEAPHKLINTLNDLYKVLGDRKITICREITKMYEEFIRTTIGGAIEHFSNIKPRGEFVLIIDGKSESQAEDMYPLAVERVFELVSNGYTVSYAVKKVSVDLKVSKNILYDMCAKK